MFVELAEHLTKPTIDEIFIGTRLRDSFFRRPLGWLLSAVTSFGNGQAPYTEMLAFADSFLGEHK